MKSENKRLFDKCAYLLFLLITAFSFSLFFIGIHNIDNGYNMRGLNGELGLNLEDRGLDGVIRNPSETYQMGLKQAITGAFLIFWCGLVMAKWYWL